MITPALLIYCLQLPGGGGVSGLATGRWGAKPRTGEGERGEAYDLNIIGEGKRDESTWVHVAKEWHDGAVEFPRVAPFQYQSIVEA